ncbi:MAG: transglycosylase domain-containing protein [Candidatus Gracilibacteria bacterium]|nr:transglycosylase domain-containing protein [Candidatus Gracilibacteria bacterium]
MTKKKITFIIFGILAVSFLSYCFFPVIFFTPKDEPGHIFLRDRNGIVITDKATEFGYKKIIDLDLQSKFVKSLILIEDKNYYNHFGVDIISKLGAIKSNLENKKIVSGASTITEQYIKNHFFLENKRTYLQKAREGFLAFYFSVPYIPSTLGGGLGRGTGKNRILSQYLQNVYLGNNNYGVGAALEVYFGKTDLSDLTDEEIVLLLSLIKYPATKSIYDKEFSNYFDKVKNKLGFDFERTIEKLSKKQNIDLFPFASNELISTNQTLTIDSKLGLFTRDIVNKTLDELKDKNVTNAAVFAINPKTREIIIYEGSRDFYSKKIDGQVNVIKSQRQPGSTMKPFLYLMALEKGYGVNNLLLDIENEYNSFSEDKTYISNNYSLKEYGLVRFKNALGNSLNNATVRLAFELGLENVYNYYKDYGFQLTETPEYYGYSLVLGNPSITLQDLVYSYARLTDLRDKNKFLLYDILTNPDNRDISFGVNSILNTSIPQAVKTGTSSNFRDNLIISYHSDFVLGIWVGNNDNSSMNGVTGITGAGYIWHQVIEEAIKLGYIKNYDYDIPEGIEKKSYCLDVNCHRVENNFDFSGKDYFSRIRDNYYDRKDVLQKLNDYEEQKLFDLRFYLK